ncbi:MAG: hypothetical protein HY209_04005 [Candidatus Omnitrophica bacterium]|nr:hypothetical protein [Candidatus Omnitrophota bacterium]
MAICFLSPYLSCAFGQETGMNNGLADLTQSLQELKNRVDQLSSLNEALLLKNTQLKDRLNDVQTTLQKLEAESHQMTEAPPKQQESSPAKAKRITQLGKNVFDLDQKINQLKERFKIVQESIAGGQKTDQQQEQRRQEKLGILKMIAESQKRQNLLQEQILDFQKNVPLVMVSAGNISGKAALEAQIQQLKQEIDQLSALASKPAANLSQQGWGESQLHQLQVNLRNLKKNWAELQNLVAKMQQKRRPITLTQEQKKEELKLKANIEQLKKETKNLKFDVRALQQRMVELDKRKTYLGTLRHQ